MKRRFVRAEVDDYSEIAKAAQADAFGFGDLQEEQDFEAVQQFRDNVAKTFERFDATMCALCEGDEAELGNWACRMRTVVENLDKLDRSLAFKGKRQFNWPEVLGAMGCLNALRVATEQTVHRNTKPETRFD
ncbi:MAG: hypothetical protein Q7R64_04630 [bacterium]|nr:hypothetical protein [bacterium]